MGVFSGTLCIYEWTLTQALIETHDDVASKNFEVVPPEAYPLITGETIFPQSMTSLPLNTSQTLTQDAVRMVGIRKNPEESLVMFRFRLFLLSLLFVFNWILAIQLVIKGI